MKTYLLYKLSYLMMVFIMGMFLNGQNQSVKLKNPMSAESSAKTIAQKYTMDKLKPYTTKLEVPIERMIVRNLGNGYYKITELVHIAYNSIPEKLFYEVTIHYTDKDFTSSVIDSFKRIEK
ncbi:hypothetical protein [Solitalea lacus]|uniref:hypothetical protein n=1 Tax=Solitalea lacus TaxID=2911172 RepID=UPI001EDA79F6|nr:hypothetical protein [Solitalea lacus]UKJ07700.1 hypothetical protein L2B55_00710 [Solitalea lacus]